MENITPEEIDLLKVHRDTIGVLQSLWDEVGLSEDERLRTVVDLSDEIREVYERRIADEEDVKRVYTDEIKALFEGISITADQLGETAAVFIK